MWFYTEVKATHFQKWICIYLHFANVKTAPENRNFSKVVLPQWYPMWEYVQYRAEQLQVLCGHFSLV